MKIVLMLFATISTLFSAYGNAYTSQQHIQITNNSVEREMLLKNCNLIRSRINEYFTSIGARKSSARINQIKDQLTQYLLSVGTPAAQQILQEMQANNFSGWIN